MESGDIMMEESAYFEPMMMKAVAQRSQSQQSTMCPEYFDIIAKNLRDAEEKHRPSRAYMETTQVDINPQMREILVDWLNEVTTEFRLKTETLCLAVNLVDRYLSHVPVTRGKLQLVGVCCMLIASKYEEVKPPNVDDFVYITDRTYVRQEVLDMEIAILNVLSFNISVTTALDFVGIFLKAENAQEMVCNLTDYLVELTFQDYSMLKFPPSVIVCAAVRLAQYTITTRTWSDALAFYSRRHPAEIAECMKEIHRIWRHAPYNSLHAVKDKYSHSRFRCVATHLEPPMQIPL